MKVFKRSFWTTCIFLAALIRLSTFIYFQIVSWNASEKVGAKFALSADPIDPIWVWQPKMDIFETGEKNTTLLEECSNNYILSVWDQPNGALGNKMSDYASLIGHARRLQLRPFIMPSMRNALSKIFR